METFGWPTQSPMVCGLGGLGLPNQDWNQDGLDSSSACTCLSWVIGSSRSF